MAVHDRTRLTGPLTYLFETLPYSAGAFLFYEGLYKIKNELVIVMIHWGIIGCGYIAGHMAKTLNNLKDAKIVAAASRDIESAKQFTAVNGINKYYGSYVELVNNKDIDAVYIATINTTHYDTIRTCLLAGKAVLCEKPMTMTALQAEEMFELARKKHLLLMEAMWTRFLPSWRELKNCADSGLIGEIKEYTTDFSKYIPFDPQNRIINKEKGGGALLDLGVYCIHSAFHLFGTQYQFILSAGRMLKTGVDGYAAITLQYPSGAVAILTCASDMAGPKSAVLHGTKGWIEIPGFSRADRFTIYLSDGTAETKNYPYEDGFTYEAEEFQRLLSAGKEYSLIVPPEDTIASLRIIELAAKNITDKTKI